MELAHKDALTTQLYDLLERQQEILDQSTGQKPDNETDRQRAEAMSRVADNSLNLLDGTVEKLAQRTDQVNRLGGLLGRSLDASEALEGKIAERDTVIEKQLAVIDRLFSLAENGLDLSDQVKARNDNPINRLLGRIRPRE